MILHLSSPLLFYIYVKCIKKIQPIPKNKLMLTCRKYHNIFLSIYSAFILCSSTIITYNNDKFHSTNNLLCKPYEETPFTKFVLYGFMWSKYIEWFDTLYLHLSGKKISNLQYTHHMTTVFLTYIGNRNFINPCCFLAIFTNSLVHTPMYWYFAYPKGIIQNYKKKITQLQILQHVICLNGLFYFMVYKNDDIDCIQNPYSIEIAITLYTIYLLFFLSFYIFKY